MSDVQTLHTYSLIHHLDMGCCSEVCVGFVKIYFYKKTLGGLNVFCVTVAGL